MTSEIVIMNKNAVSMAADSTSTIVSRAGQHDIQRKTYSSSNKLFALYDHSIGIMIYNDANFMGLPWETIIHAFREHIKDEGKRFETLEAGAECFISFLENCEMFDKGQQARFFMEEFEEYHKNLLDHLLQYLKKCSDGFYSDRSAKIFADEDKLEILEQELEKIISQSRITKQYDQDFNAELEFYLQEINAICLGIYESSYEILKEQLGKINDLFFNNPMKGFASGIVFAGFGDNDYTPKVCSLLIDRLLLNKLAYVTDFVKDCNTNAHIFPFAQREIIDAFVKGISPAFEEDVKTAINASFSYLHTSLMSKIGEEKSELQQKINDWATAFSEKNDDLKNFIQAYSAGEFIEPIFEALENLPKTELAMMAETLINLTSFKQKITNQPETVGGPIDVAVISKSEGFVWVKRKYYFNPDYNPHYIAKHYKE